MSAALAQWFGAHWWGLFAVFNVAALALGFCVGRIARRVAHCRTPLSLALALTTALVFIALALLFESSATLATFDANLAAQLRASLGLDTLRNWLPVTHLADGATRAVLSMAVALWLWRRERALAFIWLAAVAGNGLLNRGLKWCFERARPIYEHGLVIETSWSFPSGHAAGAMATYGMLAFITVRLTPSVWHLPVVLGASSLIATIGLSRILLQVHFFSDVLAGFASGASWLALCIGGMFVWEGRRLRPVRSAPANGS